MGTKHTTAPIRMSYLNVTAPRSINGSEPKYSATLMFDKKDKEQMADLKKIGQILNQIVASKWSDEKERPRIAVSGHDKSFIKDADQACDSNGTPLLEKNPEYAGHYIINLYSKDAPQFLVDRQLQEILNPNTFYSGCYCRVRMDLFAYDRGGKKGVTSGLIGLQFWEDGENLGGFAPDNLEEAFESHGTPAADADFFGEDSNSSPPNSDWSEDDIPF